MDGWVGEIYRGIISMENGIRLKKLHSNKNQLSSKYLLERSCFTYVFLNNVDDYN